MSEDATAPGAARHTIVLCALVVCAVLAGTAGGVDAQQQLDGEVTFDAATGELVIEVERQGGGGSFTGDPESVTIDIGGVTVERRANPGSASTYTYVVEPDELARLDTLDGRDGSGTTVTVTHSDAGSVSEAVDIQYLVVSGGGTFTGDGALQFGLVQDVGVADGGAVPVQIDAGDGPTDVTATYSQSQTSDESVVVVDRGTLGDLGVLSDPQEIAVFGREYVAGSAEVDIADAASVSGERLPSADGVRFTSPLFEDGETYSLTASGDASAGQYAQTVEADEQTIDAESAGVARASALTLTVTHERTGNTIVDGRTIRFTESISGTASGATITLDGLPDRAEDGDVTVWVQTESGIEEYAAMLDASQRTITLSNEEALSPIEADRTELFVQLGEGAAPLYATVTLQSGESGGVSDAGTGEAGLLGGLLGTVPVLIGGAALGFIAIPGVIYILLSSFGSTESDSPGAPPGVETVKVSFEVVDVLAGRTYREADQVIARQKRTEQTDVDADGGRGGIAGLNTTEVERIDLSSGQGDAELEYGSWVFEIQEETQTIGRREHTLEDGLDSGFIPLSIAPYTVSVQVTEGPERTPAERAEVTVTADIGGWQSRKRTDPDGGVQFEIPRSASRVTFTAETGAAEPVEADYQVEQAVQDGVTLAVGNVTGGMAIETRINERAWPGVDVRIDPVSEDATAYTDEGTITVGPDGRREVQNLPSGEYKVSAHPQIDGVETTAAVERVSIRDDETTDVTLSIGITHSMPETHRNRLGDLRNRVEALATATDRDTAIPRYYGTVLTSVLDIVETVASSPERVVEAGVSPDTMVEALLEATKAGIAAVETAMSKRRNVQLFTTVASMPDADVAWSGEATLEALLERVGEGADHGRRAIRDRLDEVDSFLNERWSEVAETGPARKVHEQIEELARETGGIDDELAVVARVYVGIRLLDAVAELFEHEPLRERLDSITY